MNITKRPVHSKRYTRTATKKSEVVIHWIVGTASWADKEFQNGNGNTCYHYTIDSNGNIRQYVEDKYIAHHAGNWTWNRRAIGISLEGGYMGKGGRVKPSHKAHDTCAELVKMLAERHGFEVNRDTVKRHSEVRDKPTECCGSTDVDYIINKAKNTSMALYPKGTPEFITRMNEFLYMTVTLDGMREYIRFEKWDINKLTTEAHWYCENKSNPDTWDHWRKVILEHQKAHPEAYNGSSYHEGLAKGKRLAYDEIVKDADKLKKKYS